MSATLTVIAFTLCGLLLAFTAYAAVYGLLGLFTHGRYVRCGRCSQRYLADPLNADQHVCQLSSNGGAVDRHRRSRSTHAAHVQAPWPPDRTHPKQLSNS